MTLQELYRVGQHECLQPVPVRLLQRKRELFGTNTLNHEGMLVDGWTSFTGSGSIDKVLQKMRALSRTGRRT